MADERPLLMMVEDDIGLPANIFMRRSLEADFLASLRADELKVF